MRLRDRLTNSEQIVLLFRDQGELVLLWDRDIGHILKVHRLTAQLHLDRQQRGRFGLHAEMHKLVIHKHRETAHLLLHLTQQVINRSSHIFFTYILYHSILSILFPQFQLQAQVHDVVPPQVDHLLRLLPSFHQMDTIGPIDR